MKLSILIPAFNEEKLLPKTLDHLNGVLDFFKDSSYEFEVIVCDNASTDQTRALAEARGARVIGEPIKHISKSRNRAASVATGEWFLFLDADTLLPRDLLQILLSVIEAKDWLGGGAPLSLDDSSLEGRILTFVWNRVSRIMRWAAGSFVFIRADAFKTLEGFSENFYAGEELDFSKKAKALAKQMNLRWDILRGPPVLTSARKLKLYSGLERALMVFRAIFLGPRILKSIENCKLWYDGRR